MSEGNRLRIKLTRSQRMKIVRLLSNGTQPVRTVRRALVLQQMDGGKSAPEAAANLGLSAKACWEIGKRYQQGGLQRALYDAAHLGKAPMLSVEQQQRIVAMVCGPAPPGQARWSVRLIAQEAVRQQLVPRVGRECIRILLQNHDLKPWREKNVVRTGPE